MKSKQTPMLWMLSAIYFISGCCSLIYQVLWQRLLKLTLGNTTIATSVTVAAFLGGLAIGAWLMRTRADHIKNKLKTYGILELGISALALASPFIISVADVLYVGIFQAITPIPVVVLTLQIIVCSLVLLAPTILMGSTLPLLSSWISHDRAVTGQHVGRLYAFNTFGALFGAAIGGFFLIRVYGLYPALYVACFLNVLIALGSIYLSGRSPDALEAKPHSSLEVNKKKVKKTKVDLEVAVLERPVISTLLIASGVIALGYEIIWMRTVVHFLRAEIFVFTAVLCVYLAGNAFGTFIASKYWLHKYRPQNVLAIVFALTGLFGVLHIPWLTQVGRIGGVYFTSVMPLLTSGHSYVLHLFYSLFLFTLPSIVMGVGFPFMIQLWRNQSQQTGRAVGEAYTLNAIGCVAGSLAAGLVLVPLFGAQLSIQFLGLFSLLLAMWLWLQNESKSFFAPVFGLLTVVVFIAFPKDGYLQWVNISEGRGQPTKLVDAIEGLNTTASVHLYTNTGYKVISSAGINVAGDELSLRTTQKLQAHVPLIVHGNPKKVVTIGFGSGELTKNLTLHKGLESITLVEIAPEMVELAKRNFSHINLGDKLEEHVRVIYMDAKNYMHLTEEKYDVIMNDSIWPGSFAESSSLYTYEYFKEGKERLNEGGVYTSWLPYNLPTLSLRSILKTFNDVFDNVTVWFPHNAPNKHWLLVGQKNAKPYDYKAMQKNYKIPEVQDSMRVLNVHNLDHLLQFILFDAESIRQSTADVPLNSDYFPVVEFDPDRLSQNSLGWDKMSALIAESKPVDFSSLIDFKALGEEAAAEKVAEYAVAQKADLHLIASLSADDVDKKAAFLNEALSLKPTDPDLKAQSNRVTMLRMRRQRSN